jgi:hypothetical protein
VLSRGGGLSVWGLWVVCSQLSKFGLNQKTINMSENEQKREETNVHWDSEVSSEMTEKQLLLRIAQHTSRTAKNTAFFFWVSMISTAFYLLVLFAN